jgi:hypothetical protein
LRTARIADERGLVGISLIRWALVLVLLGLIVIEGGSIIFTTIGLSNAADAAANEASDVWMRSGNINQARDAALNALQERQQEDARVPAARFEADGPPTYEVRFVVVKQAATLIVHRIGFLEDLAVVEVEVSARSIDSGV